MFWRGVGGRLLDVLDRLGMTYCLVPSIWIKCHYLVILMHLYTFVG